MEIDTGAIFLDLSKAFDTISYGALLIKLRSYGICGSELDWFENYLFNRRQLIIYNNTTSKEYPIYRGVPQGSILGPALFLLHINYLHRRLQHSRTINYADDTVLYVSDQDPLAIKKKLNEDISNVSNWLTENDISLNIKKEKTESMLFGSPARLKETTPLSIYVNNIEINFTKTYTYLGVLLDPSLNLNENFLTKYRKFSIRLGLLAKLRPNLTTSATQTIYTSVAIYQRSHIVGLWILT